MPRRAEMGRDDRQVGEAGGHGVEMDGSGRVELDALTARLASTDATGSRVEEAGDLELRRFFPEFEMAIVARIEVLHRGMELRSFCPQVFDSALQLLDRIRLPRIDRCEKRETLRVTLDDAGNEVVGHRWAVGRRLGIPGEQDAEDLFLGELDSELAACALVHVTPEIAGGPVAVRAHAPIQPLLERQM